MNIHPRLFAMSLAMVIGAGLPVTSVDAQVADHGKIMILSRSVKTFAELEQALDDAVRNHDEAGLTRMLAADFELRHASNPGMPIPRADWLKGATPNPDSQLSQMTVHDHGALAIASFLRTEPATQPNQPASQSFVVDVWKKQGNDLQLVTRYQSDTIQASTTSDEDIPPTGKN